MIARAPDADFGERIDEYRERVNAKLAATLAADADIPARLGEAMRYAVLGAGKRVRPLLCYATGELCGLADESVDTMAAAVELVHAYSLIQ